LLHGILAPITSSAKNASKTDPAKLFAIFVLNTGNMPITTPEK
jgi:hypothetical protein